MTQHFKYLASAYFCCLFQRSMTKLSIISSSRSNLQWLGGLLIIQIISSFLNVSILSPQVSALALDPSGARLVTGGYDYDVRFWDFAGMDQALQAFRSLQPCEW